MLFKRFYDQKLAQASYLLACEASGEALVVDPNRDVEFYVREARREKVRICYVTETHIHADFVSGSRELAHVTNARLYLSAEGGPDWLYAFAADSGATLLRDGDTIVLGRVRVQAMHTPGHTPEHLAFLVTDLAVSEQPVGMLSGDFIFVGDVGRPDLLERAAKQSGTMEVAARTLFGSLQRVSNLPDHLQIWPGHGAGSACGKALGSMPQSTLGYERISNWAFSIGNANDFAREALAGQPDPPRYFAEMKRVNRAGPALLGGLAAPAALSLHDLQRLSDSGALIVDVRPNAAFSGAHIAGSINIPFNKSFTKWAGSMVNFGRDFCIVVDAAGDISAAEVARDLALIGFDNLRGFVNANMVSDWSASGRAVGKSEALSPAQAAEAVRDGSMHILDVRDDSEVHAGHLAGARHIPMNALVERAGEVPADKPLLVYCEGGSRSAIAASILNAQGVPAVNLTGGYNGWTKAGLPVVGSAAAVR